MSSENVNTCALIGEINSSMELSVKYESCSEIKLFVSELLAQYDKDENRSNLYLETWGILESLSSVLIFRPSLVCTCYYKESYYGLLAQLMRCFRNECAKSPKNQQRFMNSTKILPYSLEFLRVVNAEKNVTESESKLCALRCTLQFLGNLIVENNEGKKVVWDTFFSQHKLYSLLNHTDFKVCDYLAMIIYNCLTFKVKNNLLTQDEFKHVLDCLLESFCTHDSEWTLFSIEILMEDQCFLNHFEDSPTEKRCILLDILTENLSKSAEKCISVEIVLMVSVNFKKLVEINLTNTTSFLEENSKTSPLELIKNLGVLCWATVLPKYSNLLRLDEELLNIALLALRTIQMLGKVGSNAFTPILKLESLSEEEKSDLESQPTHGFKRDLIRLIGNMCAKCKHNQEAIRKLDGIPLLLECCKIDAKNTFIMQWCIFAIHNLLEENTENQEYLGNITITDKVEDSPLLRELGLDAELKDGKLKLKPKIT